jgi:schlafen family protein
MRSPSHASIFFDEVRGKKAYAVLEKLARPTSQTEENEWRDFKNGGFVGLPKTDEFDPNRKIKEIWSKNLGAFSNSGGGVLIWGIKAPNRMADGIDLVPDADAFANQLKDLTRDATDPPVLGVEIRAVRRISSPSGFVVCYVPSSEYLPHRSAWANREYYIRAQDGNISVPTAVLRRMFYPQRTPFLVPAASAAIIGPGGNLEMTVDLINRGTASAESVFVHFSSGGFFCKTYLHQNWKEADIGSVQDFTSDCPIHPDLPVRLFNNCAGKIDRAVEVLTFRFKIFARDASSLLFEVSFTTDELRMAGLNARKVTCEGMPVLSTKP